MSWGSALAQGLPCESLRAQIEKKIQATGVSEYKLSIIDSHAEAPGKIVGTCDLGAKKIVYEAGKAASAPPSAPPKHPAPPSAHAERAKEAILTECKDGRVLLGGDCK